MTLTLIFSRFLNNAQSFFLILSTIVPFFSAYPATAWSSHRLINLLTSSSCHSKSITENFTIFYGLSLAWFNSESPYPQNKFHYTLFYCNFACSWHVIYIESFKFNIFNTFRRYNISNKIVIFNLRINPGKKTSSLYRN